MKKVFCLFAAAMLLVACNGKQTREPGQVTVEFNSTGCAKSENVKSINETEQLRLQYTENGLLITNTNLTLACDFSHDECELTVEDGVIHYTFSGGYVKCVCPISTMTALVSGLQENTEYVLDYIYCGNHPYRPITFPYEKGLDITLDLNQYLEE